MRDLKAGFLFLGRQHLARRGRVRPAVADSLAFAASGVCDASATSSEGALSAGGDVGAVKFLLDASSGGASQPATAIASAATTNHVYKRFVTGLSLARGQ